MIMCITSLITHISVVACFFHPDARKSLLLFARGKRRHGAVPALRRPTRKTELPTPMKPPSPKLPSEL